MEGGSMDAYDDVRGGIKPRARDGSPWGRDCHLPPVLHTLKQAPNGLANRQEVGDLVGHADGRSRVGGGRVGEEARPLEAEATRLHALEKSRVHGGEALLLLVEGRRRRPRGRAARLTHTSEERPEELAESQQLVYGKL